MTLSRWSTALHESGHLIAAIELLQDDRVGAALIPTVGGVAYTSIPELPVCWSEAIAVAAGDVAAEVLTRVERPPPFDSDNVQVSTATADRSESTFHQELRADLEAAVPDEVIIARWCVEGFANRPHRWAERHAEVMDRTRHFVERHAGCILLAAGELYRHGTLVLKSPPQTDREGEPQPKLYGSYQTDPDGHRTNEHSKL